MLSVNITKESVTTTQDRLFSITLKLELTDTEGAGFTKSYTEEYRLGENMNNKKNLFINKMQDDINFYKSGKTISESTGLASAIIDIKNGLIL